MTIDLLSTAEWSGIVCLYVGVRLCALSLGYVFFISSFPYRSRGNIRCSLSVPPPLASDSFFLCFVLAVFPPSTSPAVPVIYPMPWWAAGWGLINHVFQNDSSAWKHEAGKGQAALLSFGDLYKMAAPIIIHYEWPWLGVECVCVCVSGFHLIAPHFVRNTQLHPRWWLTATYLFPLTMYWWSSMFHSHKESNIWQKIHVENFRESLFLQGIINKDFSACKQVFTSAESCPAMQRSSAEGPNCLVRHLLGGQDGGMKY